VIPFASLLSLHEWVTPDMGECSVLVCGTECSGVIFLLRVEPLGAARGYRVVLVTAYE
jgi:hypothetical protein